MRQTSLTDPLLTEAVREMIDGLIDADLGGRIVKKRVALPGQGKRGSVRTIVATCESGRWFFLYGFAKNERANITRKELKALQELARQLIEFDDRQIEVAVSTGQLTEIDDGKQSNDKQNSRRGA